MLKNPIHKPQMNADERFGRNLILGHYATCKTNSSFAWFGVTERMRLAQTVPGPVESKPDVVPFGCRRLTAPENRMRRAGADGATARLGAGSARATAARGPGRFAVPQPDDYLVSGCSRRRAFARFAAGDVGRQLTPEFHRGGLAGLRICARAGRNSAGEHTGERAARGRSKAHIGAVGLRRGAAGGADCANVRL